MNQIDLPVVDRVLQEYVDKFVPAMLQWRYHLILVKGGPDYSHLPEQSHFAHIINGVLGLAELVKFLAESQVWVADLNETTFRKALALFTVHEVHKATDYEKIGSTEFSIPLARLKDEYERLSLSDFIDIDEHLMRAANVHKRSTKHGDLLLSDEDDGSLLWLLVRIADNFASVKTPAEAVSSLMSYLKKLGPAFIPKSPPGQYTLYYHEIKDIRGVLTNTIHQTIARKLVQELGFYPLLYFATGTLYLGPSQIVKFERDSFLDRIARDVLESLSLYRDSKDAILKREAYFDFETFVYSFASVPSLLELIRDDTTIAKVKVQDIDKDFEGLLGKKGLPEGWTREGIESRFALSLHESKVFNEHWVRARRYLFYVDKMLRVLAPGQSAIEWFLQNFRVPDKVASHLREVGDLWAKGGPGKYVLPVAYHFLRGESFSTRSAEALPASEVVNRLHEHVLEAIEKLDTVAGRQAAVAQLGFRQDLTTYLNENLHLSFAPSMQLDDDPLVFYMVRKKKGHSDNICSLCNRRSQYVQELRTGILDDFGRIFSNRVLPAQEAPGHNRPWCPICHLEFIFRKLTGLGLPAGAHYKKSYLIFLYVLPTFSFTPEHTRLFSKWLGKLQEASNLPIRDYGQNWGLPHYWLERGEFDPDWIDQLMSVLERQTERLSKQSGWSYGERVVTNRMRVQPHYYLIRWEKYASEQESEDERIATRSEAWAKALFTAAVISGITACKVYVTERPYLPIADPSDLKPTIVLDSPPPLLRAIVDGKSDFVTLYGRERGKRSGLERILDLSAALWTVTADVHSRNRSTKDKHIAERLSLCNVDPLAGAHFYKEYSRLNDGESPFSPLDIACEVLIDILGGDLMNLVEEISQQALAIRLPLRSRGRGKVHNYELAFREAVSALRKGFALVPALRHAALTGQAPPSDAIAELKHLASGTLLKAMERRAITKRGEGFINPWSENLNQLTLNLIDTLVDQVYLGRAGGSFARFLQLENSLADGVYYYTDRHLSELWQQYKRESTSEEAVAKEQQL